jgi:hypothetical protein
VASRPDVERMDGQLVGTEYEEGWVELCLRYTTRDGQEFDMYVTTVKVRELQEMADFFSTPIDPTNPVVKRVMTLDPEE